MWPHLIWAGVVLAVAGCLVHTLRWRWRSITQLSDRIDGVIADHSRLRHGFDLLHNDTLRLDRDVKRLTMAARAETDCGEHAKHTEHPDLRCELPKGHGGKLHRAAAPVSAPYEHFQWLGEETP